MLTKEEEGIIVAGELLLRNYTINVLIQLVHDSDREPWTIVHITNFRMYTDIIAISFGHEDVTILCARVLS